MLAVKSLNLKVPRIKTAGKQTISVCTNGALLTQNCPHRESYLQALHSANGLRPSRQAAGEKLMSRYPSACTGWQKRIRLKYSMNNRSGIISYGIATLCVEARHGYPAPAKAAGCRIAPGQLAFIVGWNRARGVQRVRGALACSRSFAFFIVASCEAMVTYQG